MALTNYGELKTAVANWLNRDDITARVPEFIALAENRINLDLRVRLMETSTTLTTASATRTVALPSGWRQARSVYISGTPNVRLEYRTPVNYWSIYSSLTSAKPTVYTIEGENMLFGPVPDAIYSVPVMYYQEITALSADGDNNGLFTLSVGLYLYGALIESAPFLGNDPRVLIWVSMYEDLLARAHAADDRDRQSGDTRTAESVAQRT